MLFRRLYNWIKYKTFPPSTLHKQRLLVERDTKHKRITSNFGLNFRNSKWSKYESYNIKPQHLIIYIKIIKNLILLLVIFLLVWWYNKYIIIYYLYNNFLYIYWVCSDAFDHYIFSLIWIITVVFYKLLGIFYSYFFFNNFSLKEKNLEKLDSSLINSLFTSKPSSKEIFISKHDLNWTLYSWITVENSYKNFEIFKNLFNVGIDDKKWNEYYFFFTKFFKMSFFLNIITPEKISLKINFRKNLKEKNSSDIFNSYFSDFDNLIFVKNFINIFVKNNTNEIFNYFSIKLTFEKLNNDWNFFNFNTELIKNSFLIKTKTGSFYFYNLNYKKFNNFIYNFKELTNIDILLKNQLILSKWNRWLYRYSILHRKVFKNSHKITLTKRLTNFGFWDSKMFNKNLWISEHYSKYFNDTSFSSLFNLYYNNLFNLSLSNLNYNAKSIAMINNQILNLNCLSHYENSYFFFLKRFYFFNSLSSNLIKTTNILKNNFSNDFQNNINFKNNMFVKHLIFSSFLAKSSFLNLNFVFLNTLKSEFFKKTTQSLNLNNLYYSKDIYLLLNETDFLSKENLNMLLWITSNLTENNNLIFFNYLNTKSFSFFLENQNFFENNHELFDLNYYFIWSLINYDNFYLNDLLFLISNYND